MVPKGSQKEPKGSPKSTDVEISAFKNRCGRQSRCALPKIRFLGAFLAPFTFRFQCEKNARKNQVPVPKMLSRNGSGQWHGKWKENCEKNNRFRDTDNVSRTALREELATFVTLENVVKSMRKRCGKVIGNGRKSIILVPRR